jgi:hypothetical protein
VSRADSRAFLLIGAGRVEFRPPADAAPGAGWPEKPVVEAIADSPQDPDPLAPLGAAMARVVDSPSLRIRNAGVGPAPKLTVLVAGRWLASTVLPWSAALARGDTALAYARSQLVAAGFDLSPADAIRIDDMPYRELRSAVAYPAALLAVLRDAALRLGLVLDSVMAMDSLAVEVALTQSGADLAAIAVVEGGFVSFHAGGRRRLSARGSASRLVPSQPRVDEVARLWQRLRWRDASLAKVETLAVIDLDRADSAADWSAAAGMRRVAALDADDPLAALWRRAQRHAAGRHPLAVAAARPASQAFGRVGALLAVLALAVAAWASWHASASFAQLRDLRHQSAAPSTRPPAVRNAARSADELARIAAINSAVRSLNLPFAELLSALQPPRDIRVGLLGIDLLAQGSTAASVNTDTALKLSAEAASGAEMTRYVAFIADRRPFVAAYLINHEVVAADPARPYRFTVEATWRE